MTISELDYCTDLNNQNLSKKLRGAARAQVFVGASGQAKGNFFSSVFVQSGAFSGSGSFKF